MYLIPTNLGSGSQHHKIDIAEENLNKMCQMENMAGVQRLEVATSGASNPGALVHSVIYELLSVAK